MAKSKSNRSTPRTGEAAQSAGTFGDLPAAAVKRARELFTAAEKKVFDSSLGHALAKATHEQVQTASKQARVLRDKWHALSATQQRTNKRAASRVDVAASRSREKLDLFHGVVARLEQRLGELSSAVGRTVAALGGRSAKPVRLKIDPGQKGRGKKIVTRAARRTAAKPVAPARPGAVVIAAPKVVVPAAAKAIPPAAKAIPPAAKAVIKPRPAVSKKARNAGARAQLTALTGNQLIRFDKAKQRSALTAAKSRRLAIEGLDTRRSGHSAARVRMKQAKRDQRSR
ncbi:MAG: hypothetical protein ACOYK7_04540 [Pirellulales bacterium]